MMCILGLVLSGFVAGVVAGWLTRGRYVARGPRPRVLPILS
jgi:hypothetical protein